MSYVFYPPRTQNFFPAGHPYLAGLGDYASDVRAYKDWQIDHKKWSLEKTKFVAAQKAWAKTTYDMLVEYNAALKAYAKDKKAWDSEAATHAVAMNGWGRAFGEMTAANTKKSKEIAATFGLSLPQAYFDAGACISQSDHDWFVKNCTVVKGLGGVTSYGSYCGMKRLPICNIPDKPWLRKQPSKPAYPAFPTKPTLRAEPAAPGALPTPPAVVTTPVVTTTPSSTPSAPSPSLPDVPVPEETSEPPQQSNVLMGGLIAIAVLTGGYLVYRTLKKPKAQAA
jgi:hypothetical protein